MEVEERIVPTLERLANVVKKAEETGKLREEIRGLLRRSVAVPCRATNANLEIRFDPPVELRPQFGEFLESVSVWGVNVWSNRLELVGAAGRALWRAEVDLAKGETTLMDLLYLAALPEEAWKKIEETAEARAKELAETLKRLRRILSLLELVT